MLDKAINFNKKFRGSYIDSAGVLHEDWYSAEDLISFFHANWPQIGIGKKGTTDLDGLFTFIGYDPASPPEKAFDVDTRVGPLRTGSLTPPVPQSMPPLIRRPAYRMLNQHRLLCRKPL